MKFSLQTILQDLGEKGVVIFIGKSLKVLGHPNDYERIIELLLKNGYRRVRKEDLRVGAKLLFIRLCVDRVQRTPKQHSLGLHIIAITHFTPAAIVALKRKSAKERYGFGGGPAEDMYSFKSLTAELQGRQDSDFFIKGYSVVGLPFPPFNSPDETEICLIKTNR